MILRYPFRKGWRRIGFGLDRQGRQYCGLVHFPGQLALADLAGGLFEPFPHE